PAARPLGPDELALAHPDELHAAGGELLVGGREPLAAAFLVRAGDRWHTTATIPGPTSTCRQLTSQLATDGRVVVRTTSTGDSFCRSKNPDGLGFQVHERGADGQFRLVPLPHSQEHKDEEEWFEGAAVSGSLLALGSAWQSWSGAVQVE